MRRQPYYPYGTPAQFSGRGLGQAQIPDVDVFKLPDPRTSEKNAIEFTNGIMASMAQSEFLLNQMFDHLVLQISLGAVDCQEIIHYNQRRLALYAGQLQILDAFKVVWDKMRSEGHFIPKEPDPPKLIASTVRATRLPDGGTSYEAKATCLPNGLLDLKQLKHVGPVCPETPLPPLGVAAVAGACGTPFGLFVCTVVMTGAYLLIPLIGETIVDVWRTATDKDIEFIKAAAAHDQFLADLARLKFISECLQGFLKSFLAENKRDPTTLERENIYRRCQGLGEKAVPPRGVPSFSRWGRVGFMLVLFGGAGFLIYMWKRKSAGQPILPRARASKPVGEGAPQLPPA
jgi:hypothetical protein